jgi:predicted lipid-binding transport protein (Tim44 family)
VLSRRGRLRLVNPANWVRRDSRPAVRKQLLAAPPDAELEELLRVARLSFVAVQAAWDRADLPAMAALATGPLLAELKDQLAARGPQVNHTEVVQLQARLLGFEELSEACVASVEFSGLIRERLDLAAEPFRELWLLARVKSGGRDWKLARVQSLS